MTENCEEMAVFVSSFFPHQAWNDAEHCERLFRERYPSLDLPALFQTRDHVCISAGLNIINLHMWLSVAREHAAGVADCFLAVEIMRPIVGDEYFIACYLPLIHELGSQCRRRQSTAHFMHELSSLRRLPELSRLVARPEFVLAMKFLPDQVYEH